MLSEPAARAKLGVVTKKAKKEPTAEHRAAVVEAKRLHTEAVLAEHIKRVVDAAVPLTSQQRDRLALLLRGGSS